MASGPPGLQAGGLARSRRRGPSRARRRLIRDAIAAFEQELSSFEGLAAQEQREALAAGSGDEAGEEPASTGATGSGTAPGGAARDAPRPPAAAHLEAEPSLLESELVQAMLHDYATMGCNLHEYDAALQKALQELGRLQEQVGCMERLCGRSTELRARLAAEQQAQEELHSENVHLAARNRELSLLVHRALEAEGDVQRDAEVDALLAENRALWKLVAASQAASQLPAAALQLPPSLLRRQRPSPGSRSARSSSMSAGSPAGLSLSNQPAAEEHFFSSALDDELPATFEGLAEDDELE